MRTYKCICVISLMIVLCGIVTGWMIETPAQLVKAKKTYADLMVSYAGIEGWSDWRSAQNESFEQTAKQLNINLKVAYQAMKQEWQIKAVRDFITQRSDVIGVSPIVQSGWDRVFQEAKGAGIPIILVDRYADVPEDDSLRCRKFLYRRTSWRCQYNDFFVSGPSGADAPAIKTKLFETSSRFRCCHTP